VERPDLIKKSESRVSQTCDRHPEGGIHPNQKESNMSGIVLSAATRQSLLAAQDTAQLLSTTQNRLASGKKVNSALDNPNSFFTAAGLDNRASDISNVLDSISNGVQVIQAANTGITSLQKLVDSAKSVANQALQTSIGYSQKSSVSTTITGATASDLRGTTAYTNAQASSNVLFSGAAGGTTAASGSTKIGGTVGLFTGAVVTDNRTAGSGNILATTLLNDTAAGAGALGTATVADGDTLSVNGKTITFKAGAAPTTAPTGYTMSGNLATDANGNSTIYIGASTTTSTATVGDVLKAIDVASGVAYNNAGTITANSGQTLSDINAGAVRLRSSTGADTSVSGKADILKAFGLTAATGSGPATVTAARTTASATAASLIQDGSTLTVNNKTITFKNAATPAAANVPAGSGVSGNVVNDGSGNSTVYLQAGTIDDVLQAIDLATGVRTATNTSGSAGTPATAAGATNSSMVAGTLKISTGTTMDLNITGTGNALAALGLGGNTGTGSSFTAQRASAAGGIVGKTLTFGSFKSGTAVDVTFGDGTGGTVKTLDQLNAKLAANNMSAQLDATGKLTISSSNDYASATIGGAADGGTVGGTLASMFSSPGAPVMDATSQATRASYISQFNGILDQIKTTAADASYNGVNLLSGDTLKLVFNETGKSSLSIQGVTFDPAGLGLTKLGQSGANEFKDNASINKIIDQLTSASTNLRTQASGFGTNLSVVQGRQDFNKSLINVLQTGSANLVNADLNEEAANSQALSTRQSLTISSLSLANQAQQSVLQLLR
jgi:flagellin